MDSHSRRTHLPDLKSIDRRRLFDRLFEDDQTFSDPEMFYETTPRSGWHHRSFFNDNDDWPGKRFPSRQASFASQFSPPKPSGFRSGFDDFGVPVRVMRETSPDKSYMKPKERHNSTGSSAATSSSTGSNDSAGNATHKPRVFHIPIHVEARDNENVTTPRKPMSKHRAGSPEKEKTQIPLSRSASVASEPPKDSPKYAAPQSPRAQSVPTETIREVSPERRISPERRRGIGRTQSMSYRSPEQPRIFHHPIKVETINKSPRNPESFHEEILYRGPKSSGIPSDTSFTLPRVPLTRTVIKEKPAPEPLNKPKSFISSAKVHMNNPPVREEESYVTRIPINVVEKEDEPMKISADTIKQAMDDAAEKVQQSNPFQEDTQDNHREPSPLPERPTVIPVRWEKREEAVPQQSTEDVNTQHSPKRQAFAQPKSKLDKIADIQADVRALKSEIYKFNGNIYDKNYLLLDEKLTQNMLKLDVIDTEGKDEIRKARKATVQEIQSCLALLESRVSKVIPTDDVKNSGHEQEEGYCSMETDHQNASNEPTTMDCDGQNDTSNKDGSVGRDAKGSEDEQTKL